MSKGQRATAKPSTTLCPGVGRADRPEYGTDLVRCPFCYRMVKLDPKGRTGPHPRT